MRIEKIDQGDTLVVKVEGWLDIQSNREFAEEMRELPLEKKLVMDLQNLEYISSSGIREIVDIILRMPEGCFSIINANENVLGVFQMIGLDKKVPIH